MRLRVSGNHNFLQIWGFFLRAGRCSRVSWPVGLIFGLKVGGVGELFLKLPKAHECLGIWLRTCQFFES